MKFLIFLVFVCLLSGCSTIENKPEPCACGDLIDVNIVRSA